MMPLPGRFAAKLVIGLGCVLLLALLVHDRNRWKAKTAHYAELLAGERAGHSATVAGYRAAAEQARRDDAANAARVKAAQGEINERTADDFESRIAAARAAAERLRADPAANPDPGARGAAAVPALSAAAEQPARTAGEDRLPDAGQRGAGKPEQLAPADALIATEQSIQLDELIKWVRAQAAVEVSRD